MRVPARVYADRELIDAMRPVLVDAGGALAPLAAFLVLRAGPVLYARDPDQRRSKGVVFDSTYHIVLRLDAVNP